MSNKTLLFFFFTKKQDLKKLTLTLQIFKVTFFFQQGCWSVKIEIIYTKSPFSSGNVNVFLY